jgi:hypothetical protein
MGNSSSVTNNVDSLNSTAANTYFDDFVIIDNDTITAINTLKPTANFTVNFAIKPLNTIPEETILENIEDIEEINDIECISTNADAHDVNEWFAYLRNRVSDLYVEDLLDHYTKYDIDALYNDFAAWYAKNICHTPSFVMFSHQLSKICKNAKTR